MIYTLQEGNFLKACFLLFVVNLQILILQTLNEARSLSLSIYKQKKKLFEQIKTRHYCSLITGFIGIFAIFCEYSDLYHPNFPT